MVNSGYESLCTLDIVVIWLSQLYKMISVLQKFKVNGHSVPKIRVENKRTDGSNCIAYRINAVGN